MDLRQIENIIAIEQEQSISKAAQKLYITQSALNQQLLKIEKELGVPLFERKKHSMIPTYAGKIYLDAARQILDIKRKSYDWIYDIAEETAGEIAIAYTPERGAQMFSRIYPFFHSRYPKITFKTIEGRAKTMDHHIQQQDIKLAFSLYYSEEDKNPQLTYLDLCSESIILALPKSHPCAALAGERSWETFPAIDIQLLKEDNWILSSKDTRIREITDRVFSQNNIKPNVLLESTSTSTIVNLVKSQIAVAFIPQSYAEPDGDMVYFTVPPIVSWMRCVIMLKNTYLTRPERYLIRLAKLYMTGNLPVLEYGKPIPILPEYPSVE